MSIAIVALLIASLMVAGCGNQEEAEQGAQLEEERQQLEQAVAATMDYAQEQFDRLSQRVKEDTGIDLQARLDSLEERRDSLAAKMDRIQAVAAKEWEIFRDGVDSICNEVDALIKRMDRNLEADTDSATDTATGGY
jgi:exonuclease VII large subunit